jgi:hypothetical protein
VDASALLRYGVEVNAEGKEGWLRYDAELDVIETDVSFVEAASTETIEPLRDAGGGAQYDRGDAPAGPRRVSAGGSARQTAS